jgi:hypothetical protein
MDLFNHYRTRLIEKFGVDEVFFNSDFNTWTLKRGMSDQAKSDFIWSQFNKLVNDAPARYGNSLHRNLISIYSEMAQLLRHEKRDYKHIVRLIHLCHMENAENDTYKINAHIHAENCCPECGKYDGIVIPLYKAIKDQMIPFKECTRNNGCVCFYGFRVERDSNDRPVRKN